MPHRTRRLVAVTATGLLLSAPLISAVPAGAACVSAGAQYTSPNGTSVGFPPGTCLVPTPFAGEITVQRSTGTTTVGTVTVGAGVPVP